MTRRRWRSDSGRRWRSDSGRLFLFEGDCRTILPELSPVETCITDPPYGLEFLGKDWDRVVPNRTFWVVLRRALLPGGHLLAFGGTRTFHRLGVAIEDAGFELRDCLSWLYGQGFPKSTDISKEIDRRLRAEREVVGTRTVAADNWTSEGRARGGEGTYEIPITAPSTERAKDFEGWGTALKPSWEPILVAMAPLVGTFAENALRYGVSGLHIEGARIPIPDGETYNTAPAVSGYSGVSGYEPGQGRMPENMPAGRWPANAVLDETAADLLDEQSDGASRFFYCTKASKAERTHDGTVENTHPTVKPVELLRWLVRLTAQPRGGGTVLDPFAGSGTTGLAAALEGRGFIGIEKDPEIFDIAVARLEAAGFTGSVDEQ